MFVQWDWDIKIKLLNVEYLYARTQPITVRDAWYQIVRYTEHNVWSNESHTDRQELWLKTMQASNGLAAKKAKPNGSRQKMSM